MAFTYHYPRPSVTVDCVVFGFDEGDLKILLIQRRLDPFKDYWALPGGFVKMEESLEEAARRELEEETGIHNLYLEQLYTYGAVDRDPRTRVISVAYYALVKLSCYGIRASGDAANTAWFSVRERPELAFDHAQILETALARLKGKVRYQPIGFELLPEQFKLTQLQHLYEVILEKQLDKRNFRKKIQGMGLLIDTGEFEQQVAHRAAKLYRFDREKYDQLVQRGFNFEV
ncbi:NUDIX domain-containing protein [Sulfidibacter corallicola]|uniref:NUDIX domain-containing protein n=1 Tax=Sulfidibacter corallicola TaxID=2818388 RepID=A0A8A4TKI6_SULCO|nr:NUDIX domain-containing protein [Sulfidibacter corallicola]QTD49391.1 NUDIX domain-containing protein [Sulfidibacter corallicola]